MNSLTRLRFFLAASSGFFMLACMYWADAPLFGPVGMQPPFLSITALSYGALGALFGSAWPRTGWRWGLWVTIPAFAILYAAVASLPYAPSWEPRLLVRFAPSVYFGCFGALLASRIAGRSKVKSPAATDA